MPSEHPPHQQLVDFGLGRLSPDHTSQIEEHLDHCDVCHDTLLNLPDDTFTGLVRSLPEPAVNTQKKSDDRTDGAIDDIAASHSATMILQSGESVEPTELPEELQNHPRYHIIEKIGQGGMGAVYRAQHRLMNRPVALKLINSQLIRHPHAVERFRREVQAAAQLHHPNIVAAYDAEQAGDIHFLAMEFVEGIDFAAVVEQRGPLPISDACKFIHQAALGLQHAHEKGMVHRDIKPHNLMLSPDGQVRILDFGLAAFVTESALIEPGTSQDSNEEAMPPHLTAVGSVMGTPDYIAPEQARDAHSADIRADIYSLGCTLHFLLTGNPPFANGGVLEKLESHANAEPEPIEMININVPPELADVIRRMMSKDPADRFQTPAEVADALAPFVDHHRSADTVSVAAPAADRAWWPLSGVAKVAIGLATLLLFGVVYVVTDTGTLVIDSEDENVEIAVRPLLHDSQEGNKYSVAIQYRIGDTITGSSICRLHSGAYMVDLKGRENEFELSQDRFVLKRGGKITVTITSRRQPIQPREDVPARALSDLDRLQGNWVAESGMRNGQPLLLYQVGIQRAVISGNELHIEMPGEIVGDGFVSLIESTNPKQMFLQVSGRNKGMRAIYKLEGDLLTLCMDQDPAGKLPAEFATTTDSTIDMVILRKVDKQELSQPKSETQPKRVPDSGRISTQTSTGILTNPPSVPPGGLPVGRNLVIDASLEDTQTGRLPTGWYAWLNDGPDFKCEVVDGGITGKHCLQISGSGTRGVVFATSIPLDRTKRYALKGHVKVEGEAGTWAVVKLNYFNNTGWLGVDDRVGVTTSDLDWKLFEKTDMADKYPTATLIVPTCHIEGNGTAWFDDLEVVAYDREKLPDNFDATRRTARTIE